MKAVMVIFLVMLCIGTGCFADEGTQAAVATGAYTRMQYCGEMVMAPVAEAKEVVNEAMGTHAEITYDGSGDRKHETSGPKIRIVF